MLASATVEPEGSGIVVRVNGEFDMTTAPVLAEALQRAVSAGHDVVIDLDAATFVDLTCLRLMLDAKFAISAADKSLALRAVPYGLERMVTSLGLNEVLPTVS